MTFSRLIGTTTATVLGFGIAATASAQAPYKTLPTAGSRPTSAPAPSKTYPSRLQPAPISVPSKTLPAIQSAPIAPSKVMPAPSIMPPPAAPSKTWPAAAGFSGSGRDCGSADNA